MSKAARIVVASIISVGVMFYAATLAKVLWGWNTYTITGCIILAALVGVLLLESTYEEDQ